MQWPAPAPRSPAPAAPVWRRWLPWPRLPGIETSVSVFVDDVEQAVRAIDVGATDLLLRDWDVERIGELREALPGHLLVERTAFPPGIEIDDAREQLPAAVFTTWLGLVDGSGAARPRYRWAPGKDMEPPVPPDRLSAEWMDRAWVTGEAPDGLSAAGPLQPILERSLEGSDPRPPKSSRCSGVVGHRSTPSPVSPTR